MKKIDLLFKEKKKAYAIVIGNNLLKNISEIINAGAYSKILIVTDETVTSLFLNKVLSSLPATTQSVILPAGEKEKNITSIQKIWKALHSTQCDRKSLVINLGGGVIGDMGGFAASTYMRGINFINIPTTLLSQVDASIGGKTGIDFADVKNLVGTTSQPKMVIIDTQTLSTLPKREMLSGFAEIIKHGLIANRKYFQMVTMKKPEDFSHEELVKIISDSCEIKAQIIQNDETETGERKLLNFGHTVGHAIEALSLATENPLLHGEAVSIGMIAEAKISQLLNMITENDMQLIKNSLENANLPTSLRDHEVAKQSITNIINKMQSDKKNERTKINFTLLSTIGKAVINQNDVPAHIIEKALIYIKT